MSKSYDLGLLGGGQLARMSIMAAQRMGMKCLSLDSGRATPASQVADSRVGDLSDPQAVAEIFESCALVTLENEFIPATTIREALAIAKREESIVVPGMEALATIQDKLLQREALIRAGVPSPMAFAIKDRPPEDLSFPMVLKARFGGYDGKGTRFAASAEEFDAYRHLWEGGGWLAEEYVPFRRELAAIVFQSSFGSGCFPTMETIQNNHVCDLVFPGDVDAGIVATSAVAAVGGIGLFGVELFELDDQQILVNEIAPRPHNTGHYSLDWGGVSQFEQHVRVCTGLPPAAISGGAVCMANLLGTGQPGSLRLATHLALEDPGVRVHWYGKEDPRAGRKLGHLNVVDQGASVSELVSRARAARDRFFAGWASK